MYYCVYMCIYTLSYIVLYIYYIVYIYVCKCEKNDPSEESSKGTNSQPLFSGAGVGASLSWFPLIGNQCTVPVQCQNPINQVCQVDDFRHSQIDWSHLWERVKGNRTTHRIRSRDYGWETGKNLYPIER